MATETTRFKDNSEMLIIEAGNREEVMKTMYEVIDAFNPKAEGMFASLTLQDMLVAMYNKGIKAGSVK